MQTHLIMLTKVVAVKKLKPRIKLLLFTALMRKVCSI